MTVRFIVIRVLAVLSVILGVNYVVWRWLESVNWEAWWIAVPLVIAETYSLVDTFLFSVTMWRARQRPAPTSPPQGTVDVFITTYNEPVELVMTTARAATRITYPHRTWVLDDTAPPADIDWQKVELPDLEAESGRGLALAQTVLDGLRHDPRPDGNTWTLWRTLPDGAELG